MTEIECDKVANPPYQLLFIAYFPLEVNLIQNTTLQFMYFMMYFSTAFFDRYVCCYAGQYFSFQFDIFTKKVKRRRPVGRVGGGGVRGLRTPPPPKSQKGPPDGIVKG